MLAPLRTPDVLLLDYKKRFAKASLRPPSFPFRRNQPHAALYDQVRFAFQRTDSETHPIACRGSRLKDGTWGKLVHSGLAEWLILPGVVFERRSHWATYAAKPYSGHHPALRHGWDSRLPDRVKKNSISDNNSCLSCPPPFAKGRCHASMNCHAPRNKEFSFHSHHASRPFYRSQ